MASVILAITSATSYMDCAMSVMPGGGGGGHGNPLGPWTISFHPGLTGRQH